MIPFCFHFALISYGDYSTVERRKSTRCLYSWGGVDAPDGKELSGDPDVPRRGGHIGIESLCRIAVPISVICSDMRHTPNQHEEEIKMEKIVQTAGRKSLGEFAPEFAHYNDDILFGENWNNGDIDLKTRCIITVVALMSTGMTDSSLKYHLENAKNAGVTKEEIAAVITHVAFYAGWPKGWAVFNMAKEVWTETASAQDAKAAHALR